MTEPRDRNAQLLGLLGAGALALTACSGADASEGETIQISGSSTVAPITELVAADGGFDVEVAAEGTTSGFERFCAGQTQINNASEAIPGEGQPVDFVAICEENGVEFIELPIGLDSLALVRHQSNDFATELTLEELRAIWEPESTVTSWSDVRPEWPDEQIELVGRPAGSGTFDVFTHQVVGETGQIREDYRMTDDLDQLATWISEDENALGFMGIGNYYTAADDEVREQISTVEIDGVAPTLENAQNGSYTPLTRPLFIYVSTDALETNAAVEEFVTYYVDNAYEIMPRTFFYRLAEADYGDVRDRLNSGTTGSLYEGDPFREESVTELLQ
ncbi:PstS family phosphate ABC transporter substrate-binding protein [Nesterenkonia alkaliphila]|uniref:Phosphate ABC transporter substrate-binding protein n=1 Tax=Nesterenkonia alkaliphila TaxID=1463631 RepID=A0A7K1ULE3_9MICC|nr:PstS family phosphate ABC transporter substrate-binding protein [Nesterenkonia alkaliphila]MVT27279.1 phosphate ABC transporter substrate-binding protein [Nesterenkonia alkaliphila]GFZ78129.1 phosphate ABC transporter substrate-binding protein [Nesterenkonia alkaliphila]